MIRSYYIPCYIVEDINPWMYIFESSVTIVFGYKHVINYLVRTLHWRISCGALTIVQTRFIEKYRRKGMKYLLKSDTFSKSTSLGTGI